MCSNKNLSKFWIGINLYFLPLNEKIWEEDFDKDYNDVKEKYKPTYLQTQIHFYSMIIPFFAFLIGFLMNIFFYQTGFAKWFLVGILIYILLYFILTNKRYHNYVDKKFKALK